MLNFVKKGEGVDLVSYNTEILKQNFPHCFDRDGNFDNQKFQETVLKETNIANEGYGLSWLGKSYAKVLARPNTETVLSPNSAHNFEDENSASENVYIKGDNLDVLKHLNNSYSEEIDMIYIDPPYNTGNDDFVYDDNYNFTKSRLADLANINELEAEKIIDYIDKKSNSHSAWLTFMYPRLFIARELLSDYGVIFISIDDNEQANLKLLCDEVFGEENFITSFIWKNKSGGGNDSKYVAIEHEYVVAYAKNKQYLPPLFEKYEEEYLKRYDEEDSIGKYYWDTFKRKSGKQYYAIECPDGTILENDEYGNPISWLRSEKTFLQNKEDGEVRFVKNKNDEWVVQFKQRLPKGKKPRSLYFKDTVITDKGQTQDGSEELMELFNKDIFDNPKPVELIKYFVSIILEGNGTVLDFFSGSATTAQAVLELNAEDGGDRNFIIVQLPQDLDAALKRSSSEKKRKLERTVEFLDSIDKPYDLAEIGIERIKRAAKKVENSTDKKDLDLGFKVFELNDITTEQLNQMEEFKPDELIADENILNTFGRETVLDTWKLYDGAQMYDNYEVITIGNYSSYKVGDVLYLLDKEFNTVEDLKALIEKIEKNDAFTPRKIVLFGYSFTTSEIKTIQENIKHLKNGLKKANVFVEVRY